VQLLTKSGLDWTNKYAGAVAALANINVKTAYVDGERALRQNRGSEASSRRNRTLC
jgi:ATP-dependent DNA ligase